MNQQELVANNRLTKKDAIDLREHLKILVHQEFRSRALAGNRNIKFVLRDLYLQRINGVVTQQNEKNLFTVLLGKVWNVGFYGTNAIFPTTPVLKVYNKLCLYTQKPLTREEIFSLLQELEARRYVLYMYRNNTNNPHKTFYLEDLNLHLVGNHVVIDLAEKIENHWLVSNLENFSSNIEKYMITPFSRRNLNSLIINIRTYLNISN